MKTIWKMPRNSKVLSCYLPEFTGTEKRFIIKFKNQYVYDDIFFFNLLIKWDPKIEYKFAQRGNDKNTIYLNTARIK